MINKFLCVVFTFYMLYKDQEYVGAEDIEEVAKECGVGYKFALSVLQTSGAIKPWRNGIWKKSNMS